MISIKEVCKAYRGGVQALDRVSLEVAEHEICVILGHNGAGKSTLFKILLGLIKADSGTVEVDAIPNARTVEVNRRLGYVSERVSLYDQLTARQNLRFFQALSSRTASESTEALLERIGIQEKFFDSAVGKFSKGIRQRLGIAVVLAKGAKYLILDEPTSGLDPASAFQLRKLLSMLRDSGHGVLIATHDLLFAKELGHRVVILQQGRVVHTLSSDALTVQSMESCFVGDIANEEREFGSG